MIISSAQIHAVLKAKNQPKRKKNTPNVKGRSSKTDPVESSGELQMVDKIKQAVLQENDVRPDKVAIIKYKISKGNYPISGSAVADKMISRSLVDSILSTDDDT